MNRPNHIRAILLDWAGTTVDHGSIAPVLALQTLFRKHGIELDAEDARRDMGLLKRDHIAAILKLHNVAAAWTAVTGALPEDSTLDALFAEFGPLQMSIIEQHSRLLPGVAGTVQVWQNQGLLIGTSTGYTRAMLTPVLLNAAAEGYRPDTTVCPDEVGAGRPAPWMLQRNMQLLGVYPPSACVKIGDTLSDIEEGKNAGMWTIGLTRTGNMVGLDEASWSALSAVEQRRRLTAASDAMRRAGADFVAEDLAACHSLLAEMSAAS